MSRIDDLIQELCPDGVEHVELRSTGTWYGGGTPSKSKLEYWTGGSVPWISPKDMGGRIVDSSIDMITEAAVAGSAAKLVPPTSIAMVVRSSILDHTFPTAIVPVAVALNQDMKAVVPHEGIMVEYLAHVLSSRGQDILRKASKSGGSVTSINSPQLLNYRIPMPPLEVQREIVRVLDKFTQLEVELEAELEARRAQYEHYRAGLLQYDLDQVDSVTVSEGFETRNGYTPAKLDPTNWANGTVPWFRMEDIRENGRVLDSALQKISEKAVKGGRCFPANSLIFATSATIGEHALITVPFMSNQRFTALWPKLDYARRFDIKFLFHYGFVIDEWCRNNTTTSSFASVDMAGFKRLRIPIPPIEEQKRVAYQLDRFDALVNDISIGLPAELAARRKQYEHYRDRLLTFKELAS